MRSWLFLLPALAAAAEPLEFSKHIRPIFEQNCVGCHNHGFLDKAALSGGLALDSYDSAIRGGKRPVIVPGNSAESELVKRIEAQDPGVRMPRGGGPLSVESIRVIRQWERFH